MACFVTDRGLALATASEFNRIQQIKTPGRNRGCLFSVEDITSVGRLVRVSRSAAGFAGRPVRASGSAAGSAGRPGFDYSQS
jgi:hypothetical protein